MAFTKLIVLSCLVGLSMALPLTARDETLTTEELKALEEERIALEQARSAHYKFSTSIQDRISDLTNVREEVRDGLNVKGSYTSKDGYFERTIHYVADDKGYRVVKEVVTPLNVDGPKIDPHGTAQVRVDINGAGMSYAIKAVPETEVEDKEFESV
jgi:hypothetical protein